MSTNQKCSLLVVDDEPYILTTLAALLAPDFNVFAADSGEAAQQIFADNNIDLILTDQKMPNMSGVQLLEWVRERHPLTVRLLMTGFAELEDAVEAINRGKVYRYLFKPWRVDELIQVLREASNLFKLERENKRLVEELRQANIEMEHVNVRLEQRVLERTQRLEEANHELQQKNMMLEKLALTDPLTSVPNRRAIDRLADAEIRRRTRYPSALALGIIDADHFREINRRYLYPGGDQVLIDLAKVLNTSVRTVDTVGRVGGEEFIVVAPETNMEGAITLAERIRSSVESFPFAYQGESIKVTVSVGFAVADMSSVVEYDQLKHSAAAALGEAKASGRNRAIIRAFGVGPDPFRRSIEDPASTSQTSMS